MAENEVEQTTEQESPTVEQEQPEAEVTEAAGKPEKTPGTEAEDEPEQDSQERNWKALREEKKALEEELRRVKSQEPQPDLNEANKVAGTWLTPEDNMSMQLDEFKAQQSYPELDKDSGNFDPLFFKIVAGEYTNAINRHVSDKIAGKQTPLPKVSAIARAAKAEWDSRFGELSKKAQQEGADAAKQSVKKKEATVEAEGRSDRREAPSEDVENLKNRSRRGDYGAVAERLSRSGL